MAESGQNPIFNENDTLDINELASLNNDISDDLIEQLQNQASLSANKLLGQRSQLPNDDSELFEEVQDAPETVNEAPTSIETPNEQNENDNQASTITKENKANIINNIEENFDDNFIKKYKARLNKQMQANDEEMITDSSLPRSTASEETNSAKPANEESIENLTNGNITEKPINKDDLAYNDSLDLLDNNVKYSKYVIYIDPENKDFIESLTVKERKNLVNKLIREQDDIALTKRKLNNLQAIIKHAIIAILTIALSIPLIYMAINASLEATINNHRQSQTLFQTLYKEHGKIKTK